MSRILLSIKPQYADLIFKGEKKVEIRKISIYNELDVNKAVVYSSSPTQQVIGEFEIGFRQWLPLNQLILLPFSCISEKDLKNYIGKYGWGYAIEILNPVLYHEPKKLSDFGINKAPQNFQYLK